MKRFSIITTLLVLLIIISQSCCLDHEVLERDLINEWIWENMNEAYLWADEIDQNLYPTEQDPESFFDQILVDRDRYSWIVDDYQALADQFNNIETTNGISPFFIRIAGGNDVVVIVEFVIKDSPADLAGLERGDIITEINGTTINTENYVDLFYAETGRYTLAEYRDGSIVPSGVTVKLTAEEIDSNPVLHSEIITWEEKDIAYIVYTHFSLGEEEKWLDSLDILLMDLQSAGIDELILDLRYNPGGSVYMAAHLASVLSPSTVPVGNSIFASFQWNELLQQYITEEEGEYSENLVVLFEEDPSYSLNLSDIYFLTTSHTASASELLLIGLDPYMNVVQIGEPTYGKCYGSITIEDTETPRRHEWAMQPIVIKFANAVGYTDFLDGIPPDYEVDDNLFLAKAFGDITDPMLAKGLEIITGTSPITKKSGSHSIEIEALADPVRNKKSQLIHRAEFH